MLSLTLPITLTLAAQLNPPSLISFLSPPLGGFRGFLGQLWRQSGLTYPRVYRSRSLPTQQGCHGDPFPTTTHLQTGQSIASICLCGKHHPIPQPHPISISNLTFPLLLLAHFKTNKYTYTTIHLIVSLDALSNRRYHLSVHPMSYHRLVTSIATISCSNPC